MMELETALLSALTVQATAIGAMWVALNAKVKNAEESCAKDREILRELVRKMSQLDRRQDYPPAPPS